MVWGLLIASSVTVMAAARDPVAEGLNVTLMVQFAPAATEAPQLLDWEKSLVLAPEMATLETFNAAFPELVKVMA